MRSELSEKLWDFFSAVNVHKYSLDEARKVALLNLCSLFGSVFLACLGSIAFLQNDYWLGTADFSCVVLLLLLFFYLRKTGNYRRASLLGTGWIGVFYSFLFIDGGVDQTAYVWVFNYPLIAVFFTGNRYGAYFVFGLLGVMTVAAFVAPYSDYVTEYPRNLLIRIFPAYLSICVFCMTMERARQRIQGKYIETITELRQIQANLKEQTLRDPLTNAYNRNFFMQHSIEVLHQSQRGAGVLAFIMIDIDYFKKFNDAYGHLAGDRALCTFVELLNDKVRRKTDHVFRYGGEEFMVLLSKSSLVYAKEYAETVISSLKELRVEHLDSPFGYLTASFGIFIYDTDAGESISSKDALKNADIALYRAKEAGRNQYVIYTQSMTAENSDMSHKN